MQVMLPERESCTTYSIRGERPLDDDEFYEFCMENPDLRVEREANGDLIIMPPAGGESSNRNCDLIAQLTVWARRDGRGEPFDSNSEFILPNGAARGPDAGWVLKGRLAALSKKQRKRFIPLCPDFVVELLSPSDRLNKTKAKMREWIENGAALGWLIDPDRRTIHVYRPGTEPELLVGVDHIDGEGPVEGFRLELEYIWREL
jgi:Uma2 family endonuclease